MKTADEWFDAYAVTHQNPVNKRIHWVCVPVITWVTIGMIWALHPLLAVLAMLAALGFYLSLSWQLAAGMALFMAPWILFMMEADYLFWPCLAVFVLAWIGQFIGHHIEGAKPAFFEDLQFLLIGPIWLLGFFYRQYDIEY